MSQNSLEWNVASHTFNLSQRHTATQKQMWEPQCVADKECEEISQFYEMQEICCHQNWLEDRKSIVYTHTLCRADIQQQEHSTLLISYYLINVNAINEWFSIYGFLQTQKAVKQFSTFQLSTVQNVVTLVTEATRTKLLFDGRECFTKMNGAVLHVSLTKETLK